MLHFRHSRPQPCGRLRRIESNQRTDSVCWQQPPPDLFVHEFRRRFQQLRKLLDCQCCLPRFHCAHQIINSDDRRADTNSSRSYPSLFLVWVCTGNLRRCCGVTGWAVAQRPGRSLIRFSSCPEGLLQLAYEDEKRYKCDFNWETDQTLKADDPARTILEPRITWSAG